MTACDAFSIAAKMEACQCVCTVTFELSSHRVAENFSLTTNCYQVQKMSAKYNSSLKEEQALYFVFVCVVG